MNVELSVDANQFVEGLVEAGQFNSVSDALTEGVRLLMAREILKAEINQGIRELDEGLGIPGGKVFADLRERAKNMSE